MRGFMRCMSKRERGYVLAAKMRAVPALLVTLILFALAVPRSSTAWAGEPMERPVLIGVPTDSWGPTPAVVGLRDGLVELGYEENADFVIGVRFTRGSTTELTEAVMGVVRDGADIIFVDGDVAARAALRATNAVPVVFANIGDPVEEGLVESYARPGGKATGIVDLEMQLGAKLERVLLVLVTMPVWVP